jgi:hypothetical protein
LVPEISERTREHLENKGNSFRVNPSPDEDRQVS